MAAQMAARMAAQLPTAQLPTARLRAPLVRLARAAAPLGLVLMAAAPPAQADAVTEAEEIHLGVQAGSPPFAFRRAEEEGFHGYSVDICRALVADLEAQRGRAYARPDGRWREVTSKTRLVKLLAGEIDLECGSTSHTRARAALGLAFSDTIFVSDVGVLIARDAAQQAQSLSGWLQHVQQHRLRLITTDGSTSLRHLRALSEQRQPPLDILTGRFHDDSIDLLLKQRGKAFVMDRVLLATRLATNAALQAQGYVLPAWPIAPARECYAIVMRARDADLVRSVQTSLRRMMQDGRLRGLYAKWFERPLPAEDRLPGLPTERSLDLPLSAELDRLMVAPSAQPCL